MKRLNLLFKQPLVMELREEPVPEPSGDHVLVAVRFSGISAGTEMLVFKDQFPKHMGLDLTIKSLAKPFQYPLRYGYSCVGRVVAVGARVDPEWLGRRVFAFHPHVSHFTIPIAELIPLPDFVPDEDAIFLPSMETAVNLVMDGQPVIGEHVMVWGLGIIGLLTIGLLSRYPIDRLVGVDPMPLRCEKAIDLGADNALSDSEDGFYKKIASLFSRADGDGKADLIYELSGNPAALNQTFDWAGYTSRIVVGSWYGNKVTSINMGGAYHRDRITLISSQVSTIDPQKTGRWTKMRRQQFALKMLAALKPRRLITHRWDVRNAQSAFDLLSERPKEVLQVVLAYPNFKK
jgi:2-desacetyl-2-hydroxyethyl bacteriochlorophyllide A dehydrogenase